MKQLVFPQAWLSKHKKIDCWINGKFVQHKSCNYSLIKAQDGFPVVEIADGSNLIDSAMDSSNKAQNKWENVSAFEKANLLYR